LSRWVVAGRSHSRRTGYAFERPLCAVFDDKASYESDMTEVIRAGYVEGEDDHLGNAFDTE